MSRLSRLLLCCLAIACLLQSAALRAEQAYLDVGIVVFDPGVPEQDTAGADKIFPNIRRAEAVYLPVELRRVMENSGDWGAVRVMPSASDLVDLTVAARILESNGQRLSLQVTARDATGQAWLDQAYTAAAAEADYPVTGDGDPFRSLYTHLADDLRTHLQALSPKDLERIRLVARMRYAAGLSPEAFAGYLGGGGDAPYTLLRYPAPDDPMFERVERIRKQEYLFIDNVDEQYGRLHDNMAQTYNLWRQYRYEQAAYQAGYEQRAESREDNDRHGSFAAMLRDYSTYRSYRMQQQDVSELAGGFNNEIGPTVVETRGKVFRLSGSLDSRYREWRGILRQIFALESGLPAAPAAPPAGADHSAAQSE